MQTLLEIKDLLPKLVISLTRHVPNPQMLYVWRKFTRREMNCAIVIEKVKHKIRIMSLYRSSQ